MTSPRPHASKRIRARRWGLAGLALAVLLLGGAAAVPVLSGRTESPRFSLEAARKAVQSARDAGAIRWAPDTLLQAEAALRAAMYEHTRQEARFVLLRNFATARAGFRIAEQKAQVAADDAVRGFAVARDAANEAIELAARDVDSADSVADAMHLEFGKRILLQKSKIFLAEARHLQKAGEPGSAQDRARSASRHAADVRSSAASLAARYTDPERLRTWNAWVGATVAASRASGGSAIVVYKEQHRLHLYDGGRLVRSYPAELGYNSVLTKLRAGDGSTPEGRYRITSKKSAGQSTYYKALLLNYPNEEDRARFDRARRSGAVPRGASPGGLIEIHGEGGRGKDWTKGCVALANGDIDHLFARVSVGTPVTIVGSDGRGGVFTAMAKEHATGSATAKR